MHTVEGQVKALLENRTYKYALAVLGGVIPSTAAHQGCFTVRRPEIDDYIARHHIDVAAYGHYHGMKLFLRDGEWIVSVFHWAERSPEYEEENRCDSEAAARKMLLDRILRNSQTGIDFNKPASGPAQVSPKLNARWNYWRRQAPAVALFSVGTAAMAWSIAASWPFTRPLQFWGILVAAVAFVPGILMWQDANWTAGRSKGQRKLLTVVAVAICASILFAVFWKWFPK